MARNKIQITPENSAEWLASCGFLFPTNERELERFNKLYGDIDSTITGKEVDPFKILKDADDNLNQRPILRKINIPSNQYKMVARKLNDLPDHIIERMNKNQKNKNHNVDGTEEKDDK